ncbi:YciI family protein [Arthrobacter sp. GMC3]|uniref:YciI family protein n=1 Tax=Arthrobacter sp. GMC3 TaxID=2058894 RepID=UPI0015E3CA58|nr:YciI family protein [Arthrobacter sp. GMC3]
MSVQYLAIIVESTFDPSAVTKEMWESAMTAHTAFAAAVETAGGMALKTAGLQHEGAFTVTPPRDGRPAVVTDGPFAEAREVNHGMYLLELPDDAPIRELAAAIPSGGHVEIYPLAHDADYPV